MLEVSGITKVYPTPRGPLPILSGISLSIAPGDAVCVTGPSGSGKSTLLYILGALEPPTAGTVKLDGVNPFTLGDRALAEFRNRRIGFVFQDHALLPQCSLLENVLVPTFVRAGLPADGRDRWTSRARALLEQVGLSDRLDHRPAELSGGEKQRAALARALIREPALLLCDEPTGNLDRESAHGVAEVLLEQHARCRTMLIVVTHSAELAARFAARFELDGGRLTRTGT